MFDFFKNGADSPSTVQTPRSTVLESTHIDGAACSDLVQLVLGDLLKLHGIPPSWLGYEVHAIRRSRHCTDVHIHLIVRVWNAQLLRYSAALENQLRLGMDRFEPDTDHSRYVIAWRFAKECQLPYPDLPEAVAWQTPEQGPTVGPHE